MGCGAFMLARETGYDFTGAIIEAEIQASDMPVILI
jgi:hypothetical protein